MKGKPELLAGVHISGPTERQLESDPAQLFTPPPPPTDYSSQPTRVPSVHLQAQMLSVG
ncbi:hypothetical protein NQZ68_025105 [Dissostichus eleginoides]|nr:hypothetical protein NQZ68_025105 [Dissostichus eleginoides]